MLEGKSIVRSTTAIKISLPYKPCCFILYNRLELHHVDVPRRAVVVVICLPIMPSRTDFLHKEFIQGTAN